MKRRDFLKNIGPAVAAATTIPATAVMAKTTGVDLRADTEKAKEFIREIRTLYFPEEIGEFDPPYLVLSKKDIRDASARLQKEGLFGNAKVSYVSWDSCHFIDGNGLIVTVNLDKAV